MKARIDTDERYPVYYVDDGDSGIGTIVDVSKETVSRWKQALTDFDKAQEEMEYLCKQTLRKQSTL